MLPKRDRLTVREFFHNHHPLYKKYSSCFNVFLKQNTHDISRFVITVPKFIDKRSTVRHRIKRLTEEVIRKNLSGFIKSFDIHIKYRQKFTEDKTREVEKELISLFKNETPDS